MKSVAKNREMISAGGQEFSDRKQSGGTGKERDQRLFRSLLSLVLVSLFYVFYVYPRTCLLFAFFRSTKSTNTRQTVHFVNSLLLFFLFLFLYFFSSVKMSLLSTRTDVLISFYFVSR